MQSIIRSLFGLCLLINIAFSAYLYRHQVSIATIDIRGLTQGYVKALAADSLSSEEQSKAIIRFSKQLNRSLLQLAKEKHCLLLPTEAILAPSHELDKTADLVLRMKGQVS